MMRFPRRRHWIALWGLMTEAIVIGVNTDCNALTTQPAVVSQKISTELAEAADASKAVTIQGFQFKPGALTVKHGTTVMFTNKDAVSHTVTPDRGGKFTATGRLQKNDSKQVIFNQVGEQDYFCEIHPSMKGKVTVTN
jgi:plastocyanin